jgi:hypothetical protein
MTSVLKCCAEFPSIMYMVKLVGILILIEKHGHTPATAANTSTSELEAARQLLMTAETICFLGFGYHPINLERLKLMDSSRWAVFGTAQGAIGGELAALEQALQNAFPGGAVTLTDADNLVVLRQHLVLR